MGTKKIILIDSNSLINRAYYAIASLTTKDGLFTNAILGYVNMLQKLIIEEKPTHMCAVFDCRAKTFRHNIYEQYKGTRKQMPEELAQQIPVLKELLYAMGVKVMFKEGFEADDIIGTLAKKFDIPTIVVSGDKDCLQLVDDTTTVYNTKRGVTDVVKYTPSKLLEEGFTPKQIIEYKGLAGDASDNIPGAQGVGEKTAKNLLAEYGSIDNIYANIDRIKGKLQERLLASKDTVYLSQQLATINVNMAIDNQLDDFSFHYPMPLEAKKIMQKLEFTRILDKFTFDEPSDESVIPTSDISEPEITVIELNSLIDVKKMADEIPLGSKICIEWGNKVIIAYDNKEYVVEVSQDMLGSGISEYEISEIIAPLYGKNYTNIMFDVKEKMRFLNQLDISLDMPYEDVLLKGYLINCNKIIKEQSSLLTDYGFEGKNIPSEILRLNEILDEKLKEKELVQLYYDIELPLIKCLYGMEKVGFKLDINVLNELSVQYTREIEGLLAEIYEIAGEEFNVNSNKQLGVILFDKLKLPHSKKNKTGYEVSAEVLENLEHPIISLLLRYRSITKLRSTYIEGMRNVMNKTTSRVHTVFKQCLTATGRLSSTEPNLQNIPIKKAEGREIRKMFVPSDGCILVGADYSQIELRLLAHFSQEEKLVEAFIHDEDIHSLTASKIFKVPFSEVTHEMRSKAKAVNFGIIYGISSFGLAKNANVSNYQAKIFMAEYFETYPKVKEYMDSNVAKAKKDGYLRTLLGRVRSFPELASSKFNIRAFGERAAMNMPLQGSASDIIKVAMLKVNKALEENSLKAKLILQIHDELIVDTPIGEVEKVKSILKEAMQNAVKLSVPLTANVESGENWFEAK